MQTHIFFNLEQLAASTVAFFNADNELTEQLVFKLACYGCNGKGTYNYYDPTYDALGYYECGREKPEVQNCITCNKTGAILIHFKTGKELVAWVADRLKHQDWSLNYSECGDVLRYKNFYQSITQSLLYFMPIKMAEGLLQQYPIKVGLNSIIIGSYKSRNGN